LPRNWHFATPGCAAVTIQFYVGQLGVGYIGTSNFKNASTYILAGGGQTLTGGLYQTTASLIPIIGTNAGHTRREITITNPSTGWVSGNAGLAALCDAAGNIFCAVNVGGIVSFETSDTIYLKGVADVFNPSVYPKVSIGEIYYSN